ncbi:hypothetical protein [Paenibacillus azoreducens]|uniref:Uncharacterized protein n=1 Tax=Paenibacillus azoreducens TaxID=116718 RepID=A0A919YCL2_9BACL|nr:hypothetical protein [Paenibacillus azoreducens]GIO47243.1 hypothetical protein J34TS1_20080 [Paenibacillus azoreducens]
MFRIWTEPNADGNELVRRIEELEPNGIDYEYLPEKPQVEGRKDLILMRDPASGALYWQEVDRPPTDAERVKDLEEQLALMQKSNG